MQRTVKQRRFCALALVLAALAVTHAIELGKPGVVSQYEPFGRPLAPTATVGTPAAANAPIQVLAVEAAGGSGFGRNIAPQTGTPQTGATAAAAAAPGSAAGPKACDHNYEFSEIFGKCLPAPGTDGFIGTTQHVKGKDVGKATVDQSASAFAPISGSTFRPIQSQPNMPFPLHAQSVAPTHAPAPAPAAAPTPAPVAAPKPAVAPAPHAAAAKPSAPPAHAVAPPLHSGPGPARPLHLACPPGFMLHPMLGACIAPARPQAMSGPPRMRGGEDDDSDEMRRHQMMRNRFRHRMFGRAFGFGRPQILAPVFVFILPPIDGANATNATNAMNATHPDLGEQKRIHEIHPSPAGRTDTAAPARAAPSAPETAKPIAKPSEQPAEDRAKSKAEAQEPSSRPKEVGESDTKAKDTGTGTDKGERKERAADAAERDKQPEALRGAFVNPIVRGGETGTGAGTGKSQPLKTANADEDKAKVASDESNAKPLRVDAGVDDRTAAAKPSAEQTVQALQRRGAFVNPFVASHDASDAA